MKTPLEAALEYAGKGWPCFPLHGKLPLIAKAAGGNGVHDATTDSAQLRAWWEAHPKANLGLACGVSGFWVLDIDPRHGGDESLAALEQQHGTLPETVEQLTGGGGRHLLFLMPEGIEVRNRAAILPGLDARGQGGYIACEPSVHPDSKQPYAWDVDHHPDEVEIAVAPDWLVELVTAKCSVSSVNGNPFDFNSANPYQGFGRAEVDTILEEVQNAAPGAQEPTLNAAALKLGHQVADGAIALKDAFESLVAAGLKMSNEPGKRPWTAEEISRKVMRGLSDALSQDGNSGAQGGARPDGNSSPANNVAIIAPVPDFDPADVARWLGKDPPPILFPIQELAPQSMVGLVVAHGGAGKTSLLQTAATCLAAGQSLYGLETIEGTAECIFCEDLDGTLHARHQRICDRFAIAPEILAGKLFIESFAGKPPVLWRNGKPTDRMAWLWDRLNSRKDLRLICLDTAAMIYGGDFNDVGEVSAFVTELGNLASSFNAALLLSCHESKSNDGTSLRSTFGSVAWVNSSRNVTKIKPQDDEADLEVIKSNVTSTGVKAELKWESALLVSRKRGGMVEAIEQGNIERAFLAAMGTLEDQNRPVSLSPNARNFAPKVMMQAGLVEGIKMRDLTRAMEALLKQKAIENVSYGRPSEPRHKLRKV